MTEKGFNRLFDSYEPYIVDAKAIPSPQKNIFKSLLNALQVARQQSIIKMAHGVYQQYLQINQPNIKIQASEPTVNVIMVTQQYPTIAIDFVRKTQRIYFQGIKFAHLCQHNHSFIQNGTLSQFQLSKYRNFKTGYNMNAIFYVKKGILQLDECKISLSNSKSQRMIPCIIIQEEGTLIMNRCEVRGGIGTIGIVNLGGKITIKQSKIIDHGAIGILVLGKGQNLLNIKNSSIENCTEGIVFNGPFKGSIQNSLFHECMSYGVKIMSGNYSRIISNQFRGCKTGLFIQNSYIQAIKNIIFKAQQNGVELISKQQRMCKSTLKMNQIFENKNCGIYVSGKNNISNIFNCEISFNVKYGIKVQNQANPHIFKNKILKNLGNGVYICINSSSFLEGNNIEDSLKCNVIIEGPNNINNHVCSNVIRGARAQGILLANSEKFSISNNNISKNHNGVICATSVISLEENVIDSNEQNGIFLVDNNLVSIISNSITNNGSAGLMARSTSHGIVKQNQFFKNKFEMVVENKYFSEDELETDNIFKQQQYDIRIPSNYLCNLI